MNDISAIDESAGNSSFKHKGGTGSKNFACKVAVVLIRFYQLAISPHLAGCCRFEPTCSSYGLQAFQKYGFFKAFKLTGKRLLRCRPGGPYGYDPVP